MCGSPGRRMRRPARWCMHHLELQRQRGGFVESRISTAMTLGGAVGGIGFDGRGLGEGGVSLISTHKCNDQGYQESTNSYARAVV